MPITVGAHPQNISLSVLARRTDSTEALREHAIDFFIYDAGSQTIPLFSVNAIQFGGTGATPPILAKSQGLNVAVVGMSDPRFEQGGLCVRADSDIHSLADLQGRGIGLMPISWHLQFLAVELKNSGLRWPDVNAREIIPATAASAFERGLLDAIVMTDPLYSKVNARVPVRVIARPGAAFTNRSIYWGTHDVLTQHPEAIKALLDALHASDRSIARDPEHAAELLDGVNGNNARQWAGALAARQWGVHTPDATFIAEQQNSADIFAEFGLLPDRIDVADTVNASLWSPATDAT